MLHPRSTSKVGVSEKKLEGSPRKRAGLVLNKRRGCWVSRGSQAPARGGQEKVNRNQNEQD